MNGVPTYTLGYGEDHNSDLLRALSTRTQGTYTYIGEEIVLPASMGDLMASLQDEVAKSATLTVPPNWTCLEMGSDTNGRSYEFGSLIADKPVWAVFEVAPTNIVGVDSLNLTYKQFGVAENQTCVASPSNTLDRLDVLEQYLRCTTSAALDKVAKALNTFDVNTAKNILTTSIDAINTSEAGTRPLAIRMKAQLEEMMEEANKAETQAPPIYRMGRGHPGGTPGLGRLVTSTASNYATQRGVGSNGGGETVALFSSPRMLEQQTQHVAHYSQTVSHDPGVPHSV